MSDELNLLLSNLNVFYRKLQNYQKVGFVELTPEEIVVSPKGKIFVRAVAMQFDRYLRESDRAGGYSKIA